MPVSTFEYLVGHHKFFGHFKHLVISGAILLVKPEPAIYKHLVEKTGIVPAESVFIDDLLKNVIAARECGFHAIQFTRLGRAAASSSRAYLPRLVPLTEPERSTQPTRRTFPANRRLASRWPQAERGLRRR